MMKKIAVWICTVLMVCSCVLMMPFPGHAQKVASGTCGERITWTLDTDGTLTFSGSGEMEHFSPYSRPWEGRPGTITTVIIEKGITSIGDYAFADMEHLVSVTIPDSVQSIGGSAFLRCVSLQQILLPKNLTSIANNAFAGCVGLQSIVIPDKVDHLWHSTFQGCTNLRAVTLPTKLRIIEAYAFAECPNLWHVFYGGSKGQYKNIAKYAENEDLKNAQVHYRCGKNVKVDPVNQVCSICQRKGITTVATWVAVAGGVATAIILVARRRNRLW